MFSLFERSFTRRRRGGGVARARRRSKSRRVAFECLEDRALLSAVPYGAAPDDVAEYMLGDVLVTVVLMESNENSPNTENWTTPAIEVVNQKLVEGMTWWEDTLRTTFENAPHSLTFHYDFTYADDPVETDYEPIANTSDVFQDWIYDFLDFVGYNSTTNFSSDIRAFNHAQRQTHNTDWAFTVFVVNDEYDLLTDLDGPGMFASGGRFDRAFAFPGGQFYVTPAGRPASTHAHETGHIFWARDEYTGAGWYTDRRGYYNAQNWNHSSNPAFQQPGVDQADSIMANGTLLTDAYVANTSSDSSLQMIGWRDLDGDGVFDLLDVPLTLTGSGFVDPQAGQPQYRFVGSSSVQTTMNQNSSGLQNDITISEVSRAEYRIDGGEWQTAVTFDANTYTADLDLYIPLPGSEYHTVDIRTIDDDSGVTSPVFQGDTTTAASVLEQGISGFVWDDKDDDGEFDPGESGLPGWTVRMVDAQGEPLDTDAVEPDDYGLGTTLDNVSAKVTLSADGVGLDGSVYASAGGHTSTGVKVFGYIDDGAGPGKQWNSDSRRLRMDFQSAVTSVSLDAVGDSSGDYARLEVYNAGGQLLARYTTGQLTFGEVETMTLSRSRPEIAYAIAHGHAGSELRFDNLRFGPDTTTLTDGSGAYALTNLAAGTYHVQAVAPGSTDPLPQEQEVTLAEGEAVGGVNFDGQTPSWRNPGTPEDVNDDGIVTPVDALLVITYINSHLGGELTVPPPPAEPPPYYDVDGNGFVTALDVLLIIDVLNDQAAGEPSSRPGAGGGSSGEGEYTPANLVSVPQSHKPEAQARDEQGPVITTPLLATADLNEPSYRTEASPATTPPQPAEPAEHSDLWRTAADSYFHQLTSAEDDRETANGQSQESNADPDEILPEIAVEVTKLADLFASLRA